VIDPLQLSQFVLENYALLTYFGCFSDGTSWGGGEGPLASTGDPQDMG